jgi:uncharacterized protein YndB with AHSA1/START domain
VIAECELAHPPDAVWRALTRPELLARWLAANDLEPREGERRMGDRFRLAPEDSPAAECEVIEIEPGRRLAFSWRVDGQAPSVVRFDLTPTPDGTALKISHSGLVGGAAAPRRLMSAAAALAQPVPDAYRTRLSWAA